MQFTLSECGYQASPMSIRELLVLAALVLIFIVAPVVGWLRKGYRDPRDVLSAGESPRRGLLQWTREVVAWLGCLCALTAVPFLATSAFVQLAVFSGNSGHFAYGVMVYPGMFNRLVKPWTRGLLPLEAAWPEIALAHMVAFVLLVWWQRTPRSSDADVLRVTVNANP